MNESKKTHQEVMTHMQKLKAAYENAKKHGLVVSRPITLDEQITRSKKII